MTEFAELDGCRLAYDRPSAKGAKGTEGPTIVFVHGFGLAWYATAARYLREHRDGLLAEVSAPTHLVAE